MSKESRGSKSNKKMTKEMQDRLEEMSASLSEAITRVQAVSEHVNSKTELKRLKITEDRMWKSREYANRKLGDKIVYGGER